MPKLKSILILIAMLAGSPAFTHHAFVAVFDRAQTIEIEGEIVNIVWRNPHIKITLSVIGQDGRPADWEIEGNQKSMLARMGVTEDMVNVGDRVRLAGNPAHNGQNKMFVTNILRADGLELVTLTTASPRWSDRAIGHDSKWLQDGVPYEKTPRETHYDTALPYPGLFRVWSSNLGDRDSFPIWNRSYPLTPAANEALTRWQQDPHVILSCAHYGMPTIMASPDPIQFVTGRDGLLLRIETFDTERVIHMLPDEPVAGPEPSPLGYSTGEWEGTTLVIKTTDINWHHFDQMGIAQGKNVSLLERFSVSEDDSRLNYTITITDPETFTEPVVLEKHWVWRPGETLNRYTDDDNCIDLYF